MNSIRQFAERTKLAKRVLVLDPGALGDTIHLLPALWELRRHYAEAELHVLSSPVGAQVISLSQCAHRQWILDQSKARRTLMDQVRMLRALRKLQFEVSINFGVNDRILIYAGLIRAKHRLGQLGGRHHFWGNWCIPDRTHVHTPGLPIYETRRQMLASAGFDLAPVKFGLAVTSDDERWAAAQIPSASLHLSPNSLVALKEWPVTQWVTLIRLIRSNHPLLKLVVTGTSDEREKVRLEEIRKRVGDAAVLFSSNLSISRLAALIARSKLHIGPDSGPLHMAVALGTPTVSFFRDNPGMQGWLHAGELNKAFIKPCVCVNQRMAACEGLGEPACLSSIRPEEVFVAVQKLIGGKSEVQSPRSSRPNQQ